VRFLHTADWQIGMKAAHVGGAASRVRDERLLAAQRVVRLAKDNSAEFILLAGDTFEDNGVDRVLVQKVADTLASFAKPVFVIPGNHDPLVPGSVWEHPVWQSAGSVRVLREPAPVEIPGGTLYPCPVMERHSGKDPTAWIDPARGQGVRIGVAHGTVEGIPTEEPDYPLPREAAVRRGLDYLALGHWHSTTTYAEPDAAVRMAYSGTHETTKFGERDSGNVLLVDIEAPGARPSITPLPTGGLAWSVQEAILREAGDLARARAAIEAIDAASKTLMELRVTGLLPAADRDELDRIQGILDSRFLFGRLETSGLRPAPQDANWLASLPVGLIRETGASLRDLADSEFAGPRPEGATPEVAARALLELYARASAGSA